MNGWIKLHRKLQDNPIYSNPNAIALWVECLLRARHDSKTFYHKRTKVTLEAGQFLFGDEELGKQFDLGRSTVRYWLDQFVVDSMLDIKRTTKGSIGTVINWGKYQSVDSVVVNKKTSNKQQKDTNKNEKNEKNTTKVVVKKTPNPQIKEILNYLKEQVGNLDNTYKTNSQYAYNLIRRFKKEYPDKDPVELIKKLIQIALKDPFHEKNLTNVKYLFYNYNKIIKQAQGKVKKNLIVKI